MSGRAVAPKGTKSCRTQRDFCSSICSSVRLSVGQSPPGPLRPEICPLRLEICLSNLKSVLPAAGTQISPFSVQICPLRPQIWLLCQQFSPQISNLLSDLKSAFKPQVCPLRPQTGRVDGQTKVPLCSTVCSTVFFGATALLPLTPIHNHAKQGNVHR